MIALPGVWTLQMTHLVGKYRNCHHTEHTPEYGADTEKIGGESDSFSDSCSGDNCGDDSCGGDSCGGDSCGGDSYGGAPSSVSSEITTDAQTGCQDPNISNMVLNMAHMTTSPCTSQTLSMVVP